MANTITRCTWPGHDELYTSYHDNEWGKLVTDDKLLFEFLILESAQAGLSWITVLRKREGYRKLFADFDVLKVSKFTDEHIDQIAKDPSIIRHRGKIAAAVSNAKVFIDIQQEFGSFYNYLYGFMPNKKTINNSINHTSQVRTTSRESDAISKDLKKRGMKFFGSTICYAFMQAVGMVDDHINDCAFKAPLDQLNDTSR